jgi:hypothetical protein
VAAALVDVIPPVVLELPILAGAVAEQVATVQMLAVLAVQELSLFVGLHHN